MGTREEAVRLSLEDSGFSTGIAKDAAAVALLKRELDGLPGSANKSSQSTRTASKDIDNLGRSADNSSKSIDKFSGRLGLLISAATALGPALVPLGAAGIEGISGLTSQVGFLALGVGTTVLAFEGLGKTLTAFNKASAQPTATNIAAAQAAMDALSPSAQRFVLVLHQLEPELTKLEQAAGVGLFPGLTAGLHSLIDDSPLVQSALRGIGSELGGLAERAGGALSDSQWKAFLKHIGVEAPAELEKLGQATGSVVHGLAQLFLAMDPLNQNFSAGVVKVADDFDRWATSLDKTQGFQAFVQYIQANGPRVLELLGDTASLFEGITKAAAPRGGPTIEALDLIVKVLDEIANSPLGTPLLLLAQLNAVLKLTGRGLGLLGVNARVGFGGVVAGSREGSASLNALRADATSAGLALKTIGSNFASTFSNETPLESGGRPLLAGVNEEGLANLAKGAALTAGLAFSMSGLDQQMGLANTTALTLAGSMLMPGVGTAIGAIAGAGLDWKASLDADAQAVKNLHGQVDSLLESSNLRGLKQLSQNAATATSATSGLGMGLAGKVAALAAVPQQGFSTVSSALNQFNQGLTGSTDPVTKLSQLQIVATRMQPALEKLGLTLDDLVKLPKDQLGPLVDHLTAITMKSDQSIGSVHSVAQAFAGLDNKAETAADSVGALQSSLSALLDPKLNVSAAADAWRKGLNDLDSSLSKTTKSLLGQSDAVIQNRGAVRTQVTNLEALINAEAAAGVAPAKMTAQLKDQRQALLDAGAAAGISKSQMKAYLDTLGLTPHFVKTAIQLVGADAAEQKLDAITRDRIAQIRLNISNDQGVNTTGGHITRADGGTIPGRRYPYADRVLAMVAPGEEIITNRHGEADQFRADRSAGRIPHYANGGTVSASSSSLGSGLDAAMRAHTKTLAADTKELDNHKQHLQSLESAEQQFAQSVAQSLRTDLFAQQAIWGQNASPQATLRGDITNAKAFRKDLHKLVGEHVGTGFLAALAQSGNLQAANMLAATDPQQIHRDSRLFRDRQRLTAGVGQFASANRFDPREARQEKQVEEIKGEVVKLRHELARQHKEAQEARKNAADQTSGSISGTAGRMKRKAGHT